MNKYIGFITNNSKVWLVIKRKFGQLLLHVWENIYANKKKWKQKDIEENNKYTYIWRCFPWLSEFNKNKNSLLFKLIYKWYKKNNE